MCDAGLICPVCLSGCGRECKGDGESSQLAWKEPWVEVMAGEMADRPAKQEIDASRDTDHTHLHLLMTLSFWPLSLCRISK